MKKLRPSRSEILPIIVAACFYLLLWAFTGALRGIVQTYAGLFLIAYASIKLISRFWDHHAWTIALTIAFYFTLLIIFTGPYAIVIFFPEYHGFIAATFLAFILLLEWLSRPKAKDHNRSNT